MTEIRCRFDFHPVGQGLFYSGRINDFRFVYDCGSESGRRYSEAAIASYDATQPLGLLIISHFHADHMNAIRALLEKSKGVRQVIMPYLFPAERLMVAAGYAIAHDLPSLSRDYISFLSNPSRYIQQLAGDDAVITFLSPGEPVAEWSAPEEQATGRYGWHPDSPLSKRGFPGITRTSNIEVRGHASVYRQPMWGFKFYCQPGRVTVQQIEDELNSMDPPIPVSAIARVIRDRLDDLKDVYYSLFGGSTGQNSTSVVCCHGPAVPRGSTSVSIRAFAKFSMRFSPGFDLSLHERMTDCCFGEIMIDGWCRPQPLQFLLPPLQLLLGDANLKVREFQSHFSQELREIGLVLMPHHGSRHNWRMQFPALVPNCELYVVSYGLGNPHLHPNKAAIDSVVATERQLLSCNQVQGVTITVGGLRSP
jgi:beta-lactamase superfamily II metal-dependent hydrolase